LIGRKPKADRSERALGGLGAWRRRSPVAGLAALVLAVAVSAGALANDPLYTVHITVPSTVVVGTDFDVTVFGFSAPTFGAPCLPRHPDVRLNKQGRGLTSERA
jgi:hypothetical protein